MALPHICQKHKAFQRGAAVFYNVSFNNRAAYSTYAINSDIIGRSNAGLALGALPEGVSLEACIDLALPAPGGSPGRGAFFDADT